MLQKRRSGINDSLANANANVRSDPDQVGEGQAVHWAMRRPSRSQTLNTRKHPTGTKYLKHAQRTFVQIQTKEKPLPCWVTICCLGQAVIAREHSKGDKKI